MSGARPTATGVGHTEPRERRRQNACVSTKAGLATRAMQETPYSPNSRRTRTLGLRRNEGALVSAHRGALSRSWRCPPASQCSCPVEGRRAPFVPLSAARHGFAYSAALGAAVERAIVPGSQRDRLFQAVRSHKVGGTAVSAADRRLPVRVRGGRVPRRRVLRATTTPARQPGARPPCGGWIDSASIPLRAITHAITEFEFHISPVPSSSRPHTGVGTRGTTSSTRRASCS